MKISGLIIVVILSTFIQAQTPALTANQSILDAIDQLAPNEGLYLPDFTCIDVYDGAGLAIFSTFADRGPGVRDYCIKWVYSPSRQRGLYCGANHGSPHKFNDLWEYDLASNTWIMLYKGDGSVPCHTWWGLTYDTARDTLWWVAGGGCGSWVGWFVFDPEARDGWHRIFSNSYAPRISLGSTFHYIPDQDKMVWYSASWQGPGMWLYDPTNRQFTQIVSDTVYFDDDCCPKGEAVMSYDTELKVLVGAKGSTIHEFNFTSREWKPTATGAFDAHDARTPIVYDPANKVHLLLHAGTLYGYDAKTDAVEVVTPAGDPPYDSSVMGFFHKDLGVFVVYKENVKNIWIYKPKPPSTTIQDNKYLTGTLQALDYRVFPNPFSGTTLISFNQKGVAQLKIHDISGKVVRQFHNIENKILWDGKDNLGNKLPSGIYIGKLGNSHQAKSFSIYLNR